MEQTKKTRVQLLHEKFEQAQMEHSTPAPAQKKKHKSMQMGISSHPGLQDVQSSLASLFMNNPLTRDKKQSRPEEESMKEVIAEQGWESPSEELYEEESAPASPLGVQSQPKNKRTLALDFD